MLVQWLTFGFTVLIQVGVAAWVISSIRTVQTAHELEIKSLREWREKIQPEESSYQETVRRHAEEIQSLRDWRHDFGPKELVYRAYGEQLIDHEERIRRLEDTAPPDDWYPDHETRLRELEKRKGQ